jgi:hypothetical protein
MDGKTLLYQLRNTLLEDSDSVFLDDYTSYWYLWEAAIDLNWRTKHQRSSQAISTVDGTKDYNINGDYLGLYLMNDSKHFFLKYNDGSNNTFVEWQEYSDYILDDVATTDEASVPSNFCVVDNPSLGSQLSGAATANGTSTGGVSTLTDATEAFTTEATAATPGDIVHNTTDGSTGVVLSVTSATAVTTALFGGTNNDWSIADAWVIQPQHRYRLILNPASSTTGHTATLYYLQRPAPVFHDYGVYRFPSHYMPALVKYAAWLYKYRDREPNFGDALFKYYDFQAGRFSNQSDHALRKKVFDVRLTARN